MIRKVQLATGEYYHVFNRSIAKFKIFSNQNSCNRFIELIDYYQYQNNLISYSKYLETSMSKNAIDYSGDTLVDIICYCLMPTHFHILLKQNTENGIVDFMSKIENSYSKYFNKVCKRKGPLWESRFESVYIQSYEQLLHLTRYIHLNPVSAGLVDKPDQWVYSSYKEFLGTDENPICQFSGLFDMQSKQYKKFVNSRIKYQKELSIIKSQLIDNYSG